MQKLLIFKGYKYGYNFFEYFIIIIQKKITNQKKIITYLFISSAEYYIRNRKKLCSKIINDKLSTYTF